MTDTDFSAVSQRDLAGAGARPDPDPTRPDPEVHVLTFVGGPEELTDEERSRNVGTTRVAVRASRLVAEIIPDTIPAAVRTALRIKASELVTGDGIDPTDVAEALRLWLTKSDAGPGLLPSLAAQVIKTRTNGHELSPRDARIRERALAAQARIRENPESASKTDRMVAQMWPEEA